MTQHKSAGSPPSYVVRAFLALFVLGVSAGALVGAFFAGIHLERQASGSLAESLGAIEQERDQLSAQVAELKQQTIVLERSQEFDREVYRTVSQQLKETQDQRLAVEKEASYLRRLIQEGGGGILQVKDFELKETGEKGEIGYRFTVSQLIQDFGESVGDVEIKLVGKRDGKEVSLPLDSLVGSKPSRHEMHLKHFQSFEGFIRVPDDLEPERLVVEIKPETENLLPASETFPWSTE